MSPRAVAGASLLGTVVLGVLLRWTLAGVDLVPGDFRDVRSAHTHLGYYGVLFPLAWWAWGRSGARAPGVGATAVYAVAVVVSAIGFFREGYALTSIAASTAVLGFWVWTATPLWPRLLRRDWLAAAGPAVWASAVAIPGVAVLTARGDPRANELVEAFLTWLLLGVCVPAALAARRVPAPPGPVLAVATLLAGAALGPWPTAITRLGLALTGGIVILAARGLEPVLAVAWVGLGAALFVLGTGLVAESPAVAVAGLHYAVLGPLFLTLWWPAAWNRARGAALALVALFAAAILRPDWFGGSGTSAVAGTALALAYATTVAGQLVSDEAGRGRRSAG